MESDGAAGLVRGSFLLQAVRTEGGGEDSSDWIALQLDRLGAEWKTMSNLSVSLAIS